MRFVVLGGYGNTGRRVCRLLLENTDSDVLVAGRDAARAAALCNTLALELETDRASPIQVDARDALAVARACEDADMLVVTSSTGSYTEEVARGALESSTDCMDVIFSTPKIRVLRSLEDEIRRSGRCFITDGGFHPGLPAAVVRWLADDLDHVQSASVASIVRADWRDLGLSGSTVQEFAAEFGDMPMLEYQNGEWTRGGLRLLVRSRQVQFGEPFGRQTCVPMFLEEMVGITREYPGMSECGFWIAGLNPVVDWILTPVIALSMRIAPERLGPSMGRLMLWGLSRFSRPPFGTKLIATVAGERQGQTAVTTAALSHRDMYDFTAIPAAACLLQYADGTSRRPGLWLQGMFVEPRRLMADIRKLGVLIDRRVGAVGSHGQIGECDTR